MLVAACAGVKSWCLFLISFWYTYVGNKLYFQINFACSERFSIIFLLKKIQILSYSVWTWLINTVLHCTYQTIHKREVKGIYMGIVSLLPIHFYVWPMEETGWGWLLCVLALSPCSSCGELKLYASFHVETILCSLSFDTVLCKELCTQLKNVLQLPHLEK